MPRRGRPLTRPAPARRVQPAPPTVEEVASLAASAEAMSEQTQAWAAEAVADGDTDLAGALTRLAGEAHALAGSASTLSQVMTRYGYPATR